MKRIFYAVSVVILLMFGASAASAAGNEVETQLKVAMIYHLFDFITWPQTSPDTVATEKKTYSICMPESFEAKEAVLSLENMLTNDKSIHVDTCSKLGCFKPCDMLIVDDNVTQENQSALLSVAKLPVLTLSFAEGETDLQTMITFFYEHQKLRMHVYLEETKEYGFKISSRLLRLMDVMTDESKGKETPHQEAPEQEQENISHHHILHSPMHIVTAKP